MRTRNFNWTEGSLGVAEMAKLQSIALKANGIAEPHLGIVELGTLIGRTTQLLAFAADKKIITSIDCYRWNPWGLSAESQWQLANEMLLELIVRGRVNLVRERKEVYCEKISWPPSMVFIDADHSYKSVLCDILWAKRIGAAIICGHDYRTDGLHPGVKQAVDEFGGPKELEKSLWVL